MRTCPLVFWPLQGTCKRGDACAYAHGVFECWLHPSRYRTQLCKEGAACRRSVCFFAHSVEALREPTMTAPGGWVNASGTPALPCTALQPMLCKLQCKGVLPLRWPLPAVVAMLLASPLT